MKLFIPNKKLVGCDGKLLNEDPVALREAGRSDISRIVNLIHENFKELGEAGILSPEQVAVYLESNQPSKLADMLENGARAVIAETNTAVVGVSFVEKTNNRTAKYNRIHVVKDKRGSGIGKALVNHCTEICKELRVGSAYFRAHRQAINTLLSLFRGLGLDTTIRSDERGKLYEILKTQTVEIKF